MIDRYQGALTPAQQSRALLHHQDGLSGRDIAIEIGASYGKVRGFLEWTQLEDSSCEKFGGLRVPRSLLALGLAPPPQGPAILVYDIETAPTLSWDWTAYQSNSVAVEQDWYILSAAYKWLGQKGTHFFSIFQDPNFIPDTNDDSFVLERLATLFDAADILIAHNGDKFDQKKSNARFLLQGYGPPSPYQTIDTLKESHRYFGHFKHSLDDLGRALGLGRKKVTPGWELWRECIRGDTKSWVEMETYNRHDVVLLEKIYYKMRPWIGTPGKKAHPNLGFWKRDELVCPKCMSSSVVIRAWHRTSVSEFPSIRCNNCGGYSRLRNRQRQLSGDAVGAL